MIRTIEATIDEQGNVKLLEPVKLPSTRRALVTILEDAPVKPVKETALLSETALARDWNRPEEDVAWSHLQPGTGRPSHESGFRLRTLFCSLGLRVRKALVPVLRLGNGSRMCHRIYAMNH